VSVKLKLVANFLAMGISELLTISASALFLHQCSFLTNLTLFLEKVNELKETYPFLGRAWDISRPKGC
jgi:hypothetical protein